MSTEKYRTSDNEIGERLLAYRKSKGKNGTDFAAIIGISQGSLSDIERGKTKPSAKALIGLIQKTDIDIRWLLTGETEQIIKNQNLFYEELEQWAKETGGSKNTAWLKNQIESFFPMFKEWRKRRDEGEENKSGFPSSKVA